MLGPGRLLGETTGYGGAIDRSDTRMSDMSTSRVPHCIRVEEYRRMGDAGIFAPDARLELIDGALIEPVAPMKAPHASAVTAATHLWTIALADVAIVRCQLPITLGDASEPGPDLAIVRRPSSLYKERHPIATDVFAVVEVSDTSRMFDLTRKVPIYAAHAIPEVWIVDVIDRCLRVFRDPDRSEARKRIVIARDRSYALAAFPAFPLEFRDIL